MTKGSHIMTRKSILTATALLTMAMTPAISTQAKDFSKQDIETIIKEYIMNNPEVILDSVDAYGAAQQAEDVQRQQEAIKKHLSWLENNKMLPTAGNPDGDVTVVEFFDYNCGYCKKALDNVVTLMGEDKNVKFVFVDMPILGRTSELAARWALAAKEQEAYLDYHIAIMKNRGPLNEASLKSAAEKIGLDVEKMAKDAQSEDIGKRVAEKTAKAAQMGINGTPAFIINGELYGGYMELDKMKNIIADARNK